jgi:hypothetical protein
MKSKNITLDIIKLQLQNYSIEEKIEIIANLLIEIGANNIETNIEKINRKNIYDIVITDVKKHGDTLSNSLARQGIQMLLWIKKEKM